jgi:hypothetical protein
MLANATDIELLNKNPYSKKFSKRDQGRLISIYSFVDKSYTQKIKLSEVAAISNMTTEGFCRYF